MTAQKQFTPRATRFSSTHVCDIAGPTMSPFRGRIANISASGMLVEQSGPISIGDVIHASIPGNGDVPGTIVRRKDGAIAIKFFAKIDVAAFCRATQAAA
ncbi:PilZ domain-containing protein [Sphingobium sp.]|uniref:PilZ domain-containing protein n=1 Tax=Sphingobium sp. TaxID=1912891 RepID=UPI00260A824A|nr:PilZ domain-containing protein [Sphingobium sp.]